jgi:hypothetical protein
LPDFATKNPAQAMLEGAELIEWRKLEARIKGEDPGGTQILIDSTLVPKLDFIEHD